MISLGSFRPTGKGEHLTENTDIETYISLRNYCSTVRKSQKISQYRLLRDTLLLTCGASARIKKLFKHIERRVLRSKPA